MARPEAKPVASLLPARRAVEWRGAERKARIGQRIERVEEANSPPLLPSLSDIKQPENRWLQCMVSWNSLQLTAAMICHLTLPQEQLQWAV